MLRKQAPTFAPPFGPGRAARPSQCNALRGPFLEMRKDMTIVVHADEALKTFLSQHRVLLEVPLRAGLCTDLFATGL